MAHDLEKNPGKVTGSWSSSSSVTRLTEAGPPSLKVTAHEISLNLFSKLCGALASQ
jgi:hypothetical protein